MQSKKSLRNEISQALIEGKIRFALIVDAEGYAIQRAEKSSPDTWFISQEVPDKFVEYFESNPLSVEVASSICKVTPDISVLSIAFRVEGWEHVTLLPLLGDTVVQLLRASTSTGLCIRFHADNGDVAMQAMFGDTVDLNKALTVAELHSGSDFIGHEPLAVLVGAYGQLDSRSKALRTQGPVNVLAAAVELPETLGAMMFLQRSLMGQTNH